MFYLHIKKDKYTYEDKTTVKEVYLPATSYTISLEILNLQVFFSKVCDTTLLPQLFLQKYMVRYVMSV